MKINFRKLDSTAEKQFELVVLLLVTCHTSVKEITEIMLTNKIM